VVCLLILSIWATLDSTDLSSVRTPSSDGRHRRAARGQHRDLVDQTRQRTCRDLSPRSTAGSLRRSRLSPTGWRRRDPARCSPVRARLPAISCKRPDKPARSYRRSPDVIAISLIRPSSTRRCTADNAQANGAEAGGFGIGTPQVPQVKSRSDVERRHDSASKKNTFNIGARPIGKITNDEG